MDVFSGFLLLRALFFLTVAPFFCLRSRSASTIELTDVGNSLCPLVEKLPGPSLLSSPLPRSSMTSPNPSACCNGAGGCGSANEAGSGCDKKKIDEPSLSSSKICARCSSNPSDVPTSSFGSAALCSSCLRKALRSRVAREAVDLGIKGQRVVVAWSGGKRI